MKRQFAMTAIAALTAALLPHAIFAQTAEKDGMITDAAGKTLYTFDKDAAGKSACSGQCATAWPPFIAKPEAKPAGDLSLIQREDGSMQWALKSKPLYYYAGDAAPGDKRGDGQGGVWHVAQTSSAKPAAAAAPASRGGYSNYGY